MPRSVLRCGLLLRCRQSSAVHGYSHTNRCACAIGYMILLAGQSVCANGQAISSGPGVSLLAASLPGVQLLPFHVSEPALPSFTTEQWKQLLQRPGPATPAATNSSRSSSARNTGGGSSSSSSDGWQQNAAILLSSPHFVDVEIFLLRLSAALPGMPVGWLDVHHLLGRAAVVWLPAPVVAQGCCNATAASMCTATLCGPATLQCTAACCWQRGDRGYH